MRRSIVALCFALACGVSLAQEFPHRPVRIVVPWPPSGNVDITARTVAPAFGEALGQQVVVDNRGGAGAIIGSEVAAKSPPDGYTLLLAPITTMAIGPSVFKSLPYDTQKDFAPVGLVGSAQFALVANPSLGARTLPELIAVIKTRSGQMSYATSGASTPHHLLMEMFLHQIGAKAQHVPYRGSVPAMTDVISGQIPFMMVDLAVAMGPIQEGKLKVYGVTSPNRIKAMPDLPTIAEAGLPGYGTNGWFSVVVAAGTPRPIIDKLNGILMPYLSRTDVQDRLNALAITPLTSTPEELEKFIPAEIGKWAKVVTDAGIEPQ